MSFDSSLLKKTREFASQILKNELPENLFYHNYDHTFFVVESAEKIARQSNFTDSELEIILVAAWMHDLGYKVKSQGHEEISQEIAGDFLRTEKVAEDKVNLVLSCIQATVIPQQPVNSLAEVLCDADLAHLAAKDFFERCDPLRKEWETAKGQAMTDEEWLNINANFLVKHKYFTAYAKAELEEKKNKNLKKVKKELKKIQKEKDEKISRDLGVSDDVLKK